MLSSVVALAAMPEMAHAETLGARADVASESAATTMTGTLRNAEGNPVSGANLTISVKSAGNTDVEVGWGYSWPDGSFDSWIGLPDVVAAARDAKGHIPLTVTMPASGAKPAVVYAGPAVLGTDGVLRAFDEEIGASTTFDLVLFDSAFDPATAYQPTYDRLNTTVSISGAEEGEVLVDLPGADSNEAPSPIVAQKAAELEAGTLLGVAKQPTSSVATYGSPSSFQSLVLVENSAAPTRYEFPLSLPADAALKVEADGSASIRNAAGDDLGGIAEPWAFDANGRPVPTRFVVDDRKLIQVIDHGPGTAYPVVADPEGFWGWSKCVGVVTTTIASNTLLVLKVARVVKRFGSLKKTMQIAYKAYKQAPKGKKEEAITKAIGAVGAELFGIGSIRTACFT
ncbi:hypothetical protein QLQ12_35070 [Actinoplanes sp. NEAU-A12]|uniref:Uncharacterized protein n=1 Tax=Actinoplanes sandaracinus TaxID=3045177 RepID=A0ABT6WW47_9ACTN|nr:hypothetical protein [Actinoplanes sandaracinus]MDI6103850.1 hypothetical protein [Actinoplanes sandaracinus]